MYEKQVGKHLIRKTTYKKFKIVEKHGNNSIFNEKITKQDKQ